jgi:hypothetical protein
MFPRKRAMPGVSLRSTYAWSPGAKVRWNRAAPASRGASAAAGGASPRCRPGASAVERGRVHRSAPMRRAAGRTRRARARACTATSPPLSSWRSARPRPRRMHRIPAAPPVADMGLLRNRLAGRDNPTSKVIYDGFALAPRSPLDLGVVELVNTHISVRSDRRVDSTRSTCCIALHRHLAAVVGRTPRHRPEVH